MRFCCSVGLVREFFADAVPHHDAFDGVGVFADVPLVALGHDQHVFVGTTTTNVVFGGRKRTVRASLHAIIQSLETKMSMTQIEDEETMKSTRKTTHNRLQIAAK